MSTALEIVLIEFVLVSAVCFGVLRYFKGHLVTADVAISVYISWVLGLAGILLLPYDLAVAVVQEEQSLTLENVWSFVYWRYGPLSHVVLLGINLCISQHVLSRLDCIANTNGVSQFWTLHILF